MEGSGVRKAQGRTACARCHRRKQRCTGAPECTNCQAANVACLKRGLSTSQRFSAWTKEELLQRIETLEGGGTPPTDLQTQEHRADPLNQERRADTPAVPRHEQGNMDSLDLDTITAANAVGDTTHSGPGHLGTYRHKQPADFTWLPEEFLAQTEHCLSNAGDLETDYSIIKDVLPRPSLEEKSQLLVSYFNNMHRRLPFLNLPAVQRQAQSIPDSVPRDSASRFELARLFLVYAIGARAAQLTRDYDLTAPELFHAAYTRTTPPSECLDGVQKLEILMLAIMYQLRIAFTSKLWYLIGSAMRVAVDLGMHAASYYGDLEPSIAELRRNLFRCVYVMERTVALTLKRPFSIADCDIDEELFRTAEADHPASDVSAIAQGVRPFDASVFDFTVRLSRARSRNHTAMYRANRLQEHTLPEVPELLQGLFTLYADCPAFHESDDDFAQLHQNNAIRELLEPFIGMLDTGVMLKEECIKACGKTCQMFKRMRIKGVLAISALMVRSVFTAGMTICYILAKDPQLWSPATFNDLRACSSSLAVIAERNSKFRPYHDVLDDLITVVMDASASATESVAADSTVSFQRLAGGNEQTSRLPSAFGSCFSFITRMDSEFPRDSLPSYTKTTPGMDDCGRVANASPLSHHNGTVHSMDGAFDHANVLTPPGDLEALIAGLDGNCWGDSSLYGPHTNVLSADFQTVDFEQ